MILNATQTVCSVGSLLRQTGAISSLCAKLHLYKQRASLVQTLCLVSIQRNLRQSCKTYDKYLSPVMGNGSVLRRATGVT